MDLPNHELLEGRHHSCLTYFVCVASVREETGLVTACIHFYHSTYFPVL